MTAATVVENIVRLRRRSGGRSEQHYQKAGEERNPTATIGLEATIHKARVADSRAGIKHLIFTRPSVPKCAGLRGGVRFLHTFSLPEVAITAETSQVFKYGLATQRPGGNMVNVQTDTRLCGRTPTIKHAAKAIPLKDFVAQPQWNIARGPLYRIGSGGYSVLGCRRLPFSGLRVAIGPLYKGLKGLSP
jgi:hypothetical protein